MSESSEIKKVVIPVAGLGTRFLPLSLVLPKEFFPLADKPIIQHLVQEVKQSGISHITFVVSPKQKILLNYFKKQPELEKLLRKRKKEKSLAELKEFEAFFEDMQFEFVTQKNPLGDGHAILQAAKNMGSDPFAVSFGDDVVHGETPALAQLINIFKTTGAPVVALKSMPRELVVDYGNVAVEKISNNLYKIRKIIEKPAPGQIQSNLVIVGKYVLTPEVTDYLKKAQSSEKGEIILGEVFEAMLGDGCPVYGVEIKGEWLGCGDKIKWRETVMYMALKSPEFGSTLKEYLKTIK